MRYLNHIEFTNMKTRIRAGQLRHKIDFFEVVKTKNNFNESVESFELIKKVSAGILKNKIIEQSVADGFEFMSVKTFAMRYAKWITPDLIIGFDGKKYQIKNIENPEHRNRELFITTQEM